MFSKLRFQGGMRLEVVSLFLIGFLLVGISATLQAADPDVQFSNGTLTVTFGAEDNIISISTDEDSQILLQQDPAVIYEPGTPLMFGGKAVRITEVTKFIIHLGAGNDKLLEPKMVIADLWIYGGPGADKIKVPLGSGVSHVFGGPGNDTINAEHKQTNFLYGEEGNDTLFGSSDGANYLDGGPGNNNLIAFKHSLQPPLNTRDTMIHHQGSNDYMSASRADCNYVFLGDAKSSAAGSIFLISANGDDVLDFSKWPHEINLDITSSDVQVVSTDAAGNPILKILIAIGGVDKVIPPSLNLAPVAPNQSVGLIEDSTLGITLSGNDAENDPLTFKIISGPSHGGLSGTTPNLVYTPAPDWHGSDTFTFKANDGTSDSNLATVSISITNVNDDPVINSGPQALPNPAEEGQVIEFQTLADDVDGDALSYSWNFGDGTSGNGASIAHVYSAANLYTATLIVTDGNGGQTSASIKITVEGVDRDGPKIEMTSVLVKGSVSDPSGVTALMVNGQSVSFKSNGSWTKEIILANITTIVSVEATDSEGNVSTQVLTISK